MIKRLACWFPVLFALGCGGGGGDPQTQVDIVELAGQPLVEAADLLMDLAAQQRAGSRHRRLLAGAGDQPQVAAAHR